VVTTLTRSIPPIEDRLMLAGLDAHCASVRACGLGTAEVDADYSPYAAASAGYRVANDYGSWRGLRIPIHVIHASDDTTVPPASSDALVAGVADPFLTKHTPAPIGGHTGLFNHIDPIAITVPFFTAHMPW